MIRRPLLTLVVGAGLAGTALGACATSTPPISSAASVKLGQDVAAIRSAATADNRTAAQDALAQLRLDVETFHRSGQLSNQRATTVLLDAASVEAQLVSLPQPPTTTTTSVTPPTLVQPSVPPRHPHGKGKDGGDNG